MESTDNSALTIRDQVVRALAEEQDFSTKFMDEIRRFVNLLRSSAAHRHAAEILNINWRTLEDMLGHRDAPPQPELDAMRALTAYAWELASVVATAPGSDTPSAQFALQPRFMEVLDTFDIRQRALARVLAERSPVLERLIAKYGDMIDPAYAILRNPSDEQQQTIDVNSGYEVFYFLEFLVKGLEKMHAKQREVLRMMNAVQSPAA